MPEKGTEEVNPDDLLEVIKSLTRQNEKLTKTVEEQ